MGGAGLEIDSGVDIDRSLPHGPAGCRRLIDLPFCLPLTTLLYDQ